MGKPAAFAFGLVLFVLALPESARAQAKASAALDRERVELGDTFTLRVLVSGVQVVPERVNFATWQNQIPTDNIRSRSEWMRSGGQWVQRFTLLALDSATLTLPPLTVHLHLNDTVRTNPLQLTVIAPGASSDIRDMDGIRDIHREPELWYDYWPWGVGTLLVLLVMGWYFRWRQQQTKPVPPAIPLAPPPPSAREDALKKLAALQREKPWLKPGGMPEYYATLSLIVREFLERQYDIPALESTTREIAGLLQGSNFPDALQTTLDFLLQQADLVKYAETVPHKNFHEQVLEKATQVVGAS
jgi:hypothetical protein